MKKFFTILLTAMLLAVNASASTDVLLDASDMNAENQFTQEPSMVFDIKDDKMNLNLNYDINQWGWIVFDEYEHTFNWAEYDGIVVRANVAGENHVQFGISGLPSEGSARVEYSQSGIIAYTATGEDVSASFAGTEQCYNAWNESVWGDGDPSFTIPGGFDGYIFLPHSGAFKDEGADLNVINSIAAFLFDTTVDANNPLQIEYISLYSGNPADVLVELDPSLAKAEEPVVEPTVEVEAPETTEEVVTPVATEPTTAPQTADVLTIAAAAVAMSFVGAVASKKKNK